MRFVAISGSCYTGIKYHYASHFKFGAAYTNASVDVGIVGEVGAKLKICSCKVSDTL